MSIRQIIGGVGGGGVEAILPPPHKIIGGPGLPVPTLCAVLLEILVLIK